MMRDFDDPGRPVSQRAALYMNAVAERLCRVLGNLGVYPRPLARLFMANAVRFAKLGGRTRQDCERLLAQLWEEEERAERIETLESSPLS
jgi:hypothetical protein